LYDIGYISRSPIGLLGPGDQGREGATNVSERVGRSPSPGSGMHATAYFRGNKDRRKVLTDMLFSICGVAVWHPDIDLCNRYIVYRIPFNITNYYQSSDEYRLSSCQGPLQLEISTGQPATFVELAAECVCFNRWWTYFLWSALHGQWYIRGFI